MTTEQTTARRATAEQAIVDKILSDGNGEPPQPGAPQLTAPADSKYINSVLNSALARWFDALWADSVDITDVLTVELDHSWAIARMPPYYVYLKTLHELYGSSVSDHPDLPIHIVPVELANF